MQGVRSTSRRRHRVRIVPAFFALALAAPSLTTGNPATQADPSRADGIATAAFWGARTEQGPLSLVWIAPEGAAPEATWLWLGDRRLPAPGERLDLPGEARSALTWSLTEADLHRMGSTDPGAWTLAWGPRPDTPPAERMPIQVPAAAGRAPSILCLGCDGIPAAAVEQALAARPTRDRGGLDPRATDILQLSGSRIFPNPFNPFREDAEIEFTLSEAATVEVTAYDWNGDYVDTVYRGSGTPGTQTVRWAGQTEDGRKLGNGVYLVRVVATSGSRQESQVVKAVVWNEN